MTKQEQIEEMGKVMPEKIKDPLDNSRYIIFGKSLRREIARIYYERGYRKLPKDSVVLSREEYNDLILAKKTFASDGEEVSSDTLLSTFKGIKEQARRETAEKILNTIYDKLNTFEAVYEIDYESYVDDVLWEIAKQFGVE